MRVGDWPEGPLRRLATYSPADANKEPDPARSVGRAGPAGGAHGLVPSYRRRFGMIELRIRLTASRDDKLARNDQLAVALVAVTAFSQ